MLNRLVAWGCAGAALLTLSCARLPYETTSIQQTERLRVALQREVEPATYTHPVELSTSDLAALLAGYSIRPRPSLPLRWYAEEVPPTRLFRADEIQVLAPVLGEALRRASPNERVAFTLLAPGLNPRYDRDVVGGWLTFREGLLHLTIEYFHVPQPATRFSPYDTNYPTPPSGPEAYVLYFEPGRFWVLDEMRKSRAVDVRGFLKSAARPAP
jgi:hypothetical protein